MRYSLLLLMVLANTSVHADECRDIRAKIAAQQGMYVKPSEELARAIYQNQNKCQFTPEEIYRSAFGDDQRALKKYEKAYNDFLNDIEVNPAASQKAYEDTMQFFEEFAK